jgi:hypothetical protein
VNTDRSPGTVPDVDPWTQRVVLSIHVYSNWRAAGGDTGDAFYESLLIGAPPARGDHPVAAADAKIGSMLREVRELRSLIRELDGRFRVETRREPGGPPPASLRSTERDPVRRRWWGRSRTTRPTAR